MKQIVLAHRGYHKKNVENSFGAFNEAWKNAFDGVELDLRLSNDKCIVIFHDASTKRLASENFLIENTSWNQLREIDIFNKKCFWKHNTKTKILSLEQFLSEFYNKFKYINLEIKFDEISDHILENSLLKQLRQYQNFYQKIIISSFNLKVLIKLHQLDAKLKLGFLFADIETLKINLQLIQENCQYLCVEVSTILKNATFFQQVGKPIIVWTIKNKKHYRKCLKNELIFAQILDKKINV